jgi:hypothetical protein
VHLSYPPHFQVLQSQNLRIEWSSSGIPMTTHPVRWTVAGAGADADADLL